MIEPFLATTVSGDLERLGWQRLLDKDRGFGLGDTFVDDTENRLGTSDKTASVAHNLFEQGACRLQCSIDEAGTVTGKMREATSQMSKAALSGQRAAGTMNRAAYSSLQTAQYLRETAEDLKVEGTRATHAAHILHEAAKSAKQTTNELNSASTNARESAKILHDASKKFKEASGKFENASGKFEGASKSFEEWAEYFEGWKTKFHETYDGSWAERRMIDLAEDGTHIWGAVEQIITGECNGECSTGESWLDLYPRAYGAIKLMNPLNYSWTTWGTVAGAVGVYAIYAAFFKKPVSAKQEIGVNA